MWPIHVPAALLAEATASNAVRAPAPEGPVHEAMSLRLLYRRLVRGLGWSKRFSFFLVLRLFHGRADELLPAALTLAEWQAKVEEVLVIRKRGGLLGVEAKRWLAPTAIFTVGGSYMHRCR